MNDTHVVVEGGLSAGDVVALADPSQSVAPVAETELSRNDTTP